MKSSFIILFLFFASTYSIKDCQTPNQLAGKCILINNCPHLFMPVLTNHTENIKTYLQQSSCGLQSNLIPRVCCPLEGIKFFQEAGAISHNQHATKCGLHEPEGPADPWLGLLEYEKPNQERAFLCAGLLINKKYVLTAAHCVHGKKLPSRTRLINVHFGRITDISVDPVVVPVEGLIIHENYNPDDSNQYNDIALIRLKGKISFKDGFMRPICIPTNGNKDFLRKTLPTTGYQKVDEGFKKRDGIATVWNRTECNLVYEVKEVVLGDSQICAGGKRVHFRHSHRMDVGGFLMHVAGDNSYSAVGILSLEMPQERSNEPRVYTRIGSYIDWIISNLKP